MKNKIILYNYIRKYEFLFKISKNFQKKNTKFTFQKVILVIAFLIWKIRESFIFF